MPHYFNGVTSDEICARPQLFQPHGIFQLYRMKLHTPSKRPIYGPHDHLPLDSTTLCTSTHVNPAALFLEDTNCHGTASIYNMAKPQKFKLQIVTFRISLLYNRSYIIPCVSNLMEGKSSVCNNLCMNFPLAYEYHKFVAPKSSNFLMMTQ
jgi:hypothetical protein